MKTEDEELTKLLELLLRRRWLVAAVWLGAILVAAGVNYAARPVYESSAMLIIEKELGSPNGYADSTMVENKNEDFYQTQYRLLQSRSLLRRVHAALGLENNGEFGGTAGLQRLQAAIFVRPVPRSRLLYVGAKSQDPKLAARIAAALSSAFVDENLGNQLFISKEILQALQADRDEPESRRLYEALPNVVNNPLIQSLKTEYAKLSSQAAELSQKVTARHPAMIALNSNRAALRRQIDEETDKVVSSLKTELSGRLKGNNVRVVDAAEVPERPVSPNKPRSLGLGIMGGLLLGMIAAYLFDLLDESIRTQADVEAKLGQPFLGQVPLSPRKSGGPIYRSLLSGEASLMSESLRNLRTMVDFACVCEKSNVLLVTSSLENEGKTFISSCLAVTLAQAGESVLLISGDLRRPKLASVFGRPSQRGLTDFLAGGQDLSELEKLVQSTDVPNLRLLSSGPRPPNPSELLNTPRTQALIEWAKERFDRVVIDCPPVFPINDALLWGRHARSVVFIARYGATRTPVIRDACRKIEQRGMKILGVVVNAAKSREFSYAPKDVHGYYKNYYEAELEA